MKNSREILSINLKYLRKKYNLSQEDFAEIIGSNLTYVNQLENCRRKPTIEMLDKISNNLNKYDNSLNITSSDLIKYNELNEDEINHLRNSIIHGRYFYNYDYDKDDGYEMYDGRKEMQHIATLTVETVENIISTINDNELNFEL